jgi:hypothetical protein
MNPTRTFHFEGYELTCGAQACDDGTFQPALVISKDVWPSRPRTIALQRDRLESAEAAIDSARTQGLEWIANFGHVTRSSPDEIGR